MMAVLHCPNLPNQASFSLATWRQAWRTPRVGLAGSRNKGING
jgi:hypothetical protein